MRHFLRDGHPDDGWVPEMDHTGGWKRSQYHPRLGAIILARLGDGVTLKALCDEPQMPSLATLHRWRHMHPAFGEAYERMRDDNAESRRLHARLVRERRRERLRIEAKIGRRRTRDWVAGRASSHDPTWAAAFCARVAKGQAVYRICAEPGMPSAKAVYGWLRRHPAFLEMYSAAKRDAVSWLEWQAQMATDRALDEGLTPARFAAIKRKVARIEGRIGRLRARIYR